MSIQHRVLILDTSVLLVWLKVPGNITCGPSDDLWDFTRVDNQIKEEIANGTYLVLPLASIIETGNAITKVPGDSFPWAKSLIDIIYSSADANSPWLAFSAQKELWNPENLKALANRWKNECSVLSLGDESIVDVANYYGELFYEVVILTGDKGLESYSPHVSPQVPRRRQK